MVYGVEVGSILCNAPLVCAARKRYTLAATRRDTSVQCRPVTPPPLSHSSPIPSPYSGRLLRGDGFRAVRALQQPGQEY
eukprot:scaffold36314_cov139-Isochrysis_galbana.AAC.7